LQQNVTVTISVCDLLLASVCGSLFALDIVVDVASHCVCFCRAFCVLSIKMLGTIIADALIADRISATLLIDRMSCSTCLFSAKYVETLVDIACDLQPVPQISGGSW